MLNEEKKVEEKKEEEKTETTVELTDFKQESEKDDQRKETIVMALKTIKRIPIAVETVMESCFVNKPRLDQLTEELLDQTNLYKANIMEILESHDATMKTLHSITRAIYTAEDCFIAQFDIKKAIRQLNGAHDRLELITDNRKLKKGIRNALNDIQLFVPKLISCRTLEGKEEKQREEQKALSRESSSGDIIRDHVFAGSPTIFSRQNSQTDSDVSSNGSEQVISDTERLITNSPKLENGSS